MALTVFGLSNGLGGVGSQQASALPGRYTLLASASAGQATYDIPDFLIVSAIGGGAPTAQASVDSTRGSMGFASAPYPGDAVIGLPPTVRGLSGAPVPDYPLYVTSRSPAVPEQKVSQPGYLLRSTSTETGTDAIAQSGLADPASGGLSVARAATKVADTLSTADSTVDVQAFTLQNVLTLGRLRASATATMDATGTVRLTSTFAATAVTVAGSSVAITDRGVVAGGTTQPSPDGSPLASTLAAVGITVTYLAPIRTRNSIISAGLRITTRTTAPANVPAIGGVPVTATYVLGQAVASVVTRTDAAPAPTAASPTVSAPRPRETTGAPAAGGPPAGTPQLVSGEGVPPVVDSSPAVAPLPVLAAAPLPQSRAGVGRLRPAADDGPVPVVGFYLVLVLAALAALSGATLWRLLGVKNLWS